MVSRTNYHLFTVILFGVLGSYLFQNTLGKYFIKIGKISAKIHEIRKIKAIFGLGVTPILGPKNGQIKSLLTEDQKYCRMLQGEHSAILSTFIKLPFVIKIFVLSIFEWPFHTGFTVHNVCLKSVI